jgi:hypothetical protein
MAGRKRKHIPIIEIAASALADKLPSEYRDFHRRNHTPTKTIMRLFTADHIELHCWGGVDKWWNLDMKPRGPSVAAKNRADTARAAKARRIEKRWAPFMRALAHGRKPPKRKPRRLGGRRPGP